MLDLDAPVAVAAIEPEDRNEGIWQWVEDNVGLPVLCTAAIDDFLPRKPHE